MRKFMIFGVASMLGLGACGKPNTALDLQPTPNPLVDNLFIASSSPGTTAPMGGAVGRFSLKGRCLVVNTDGEDRTPVFAGQVTVSREGLHAGPTFVPFGSEQTLPMIGGPIPIASLASSDCPKDSVFIRSFGD